MTNEHPITPPPELVDKLFMLDTSEEVRLIAAYRAGADQELEACLLLVGDGRRENLSQVIALRTARRPKPPSLKEQALNDLDDIPTHDDEGRQVVDLSNILRALEALDD